MPTTSPGSVIEASVISHDQEGIILNNTQDVQVRNSTVTTNDVTGIVVRDSRNTTVRGDDVRRTGDGIEIHLQTLMDLSTFAIQITRSTGTVVSGNDLGGAVREPGPRAVECDPRDEQPGSREGTWGSSRSSRARAPQSMTTSSGVMGAACTARFRMPPGTRPGRRGRTSSAARPSAGTSGRSRTARASPRPTPTRTATGSSIRRTTTAGAGPTTCPSQPGMARRPDRLPTNRSPSPGVSRPRTMTSAARASRTTTRPPATAAASTAPTTWISRRGTVSRTSAGSGTASISHTPRTSLGGRVHR